jgi:hypothetical protein
MGSKFKGSPVQMGGAGSFGGVATPYGGQPRRGGLLGTGMGGEDWMNVLIRAAALSQGDYGGAAQVGSLIGLDKRRAAERDQEREDYRWKKETDLEYSQPDIPPILRDARTWQAMDPDERAAMAAIERLRNPPPYVQGADDQFYQKPDPNAPQPGAVVPAPWLQGGAAPGAGGPFAGGVDYGAFKQAIIGQESGGRYGVPNAEGSGAMGIGQVMPETAKALAARIGLPYRPDLMAGTSPQAKQYQDAITEAAVQEAWQAGGNGRDPQTAAMYYHGGSNRKIWGPKTRNYAQAILGRIRSR